MSFNLNVIAVSGNWQENVYECRVHRQTIGLSEVADQSKAKNRLIWVQTYFSAKHLLIITIQQFLLYKIVVQKVMDE